MADPSRRSRPSHAALEPSCVGRLPCACSGTSTKSCSRRRGQGPGCGDPDVLKRVQLQTDIHKLEALRAADLDQQVQARWELKRLPQLGYVFILCSWFENG